MWRQIDADEIEKPERAAGRNAKRATHDHVGLLNRQTCFQRLDYRHRYPEAADAVGDETGRVAAIEDRLAKNLVACFSDQIPRAIRRRLPGDDLDERHYPRRIEEMGDHKALAESLALAVDKQLQRNRRRVRGDDGFGLANSVDSRKQFTLDIQILDDRLDDPVHIGKLRQIVLDIARLDEFRPRRVHETGDLQLPRDAGFRGGAAPTLLARDVE